MRRFNHTGEINLAKESKYEKIIFTYDIVGEPGFSNAKVRNMGKTDDNHIFNHVSFITGYSRFNDVKRQYIINDPIYLGFIKNDELYPITFTNEEFVRYVLYNDAYDKRIIYDPAMCRYVITAREI